jgi:spore germination protein GerM
MLEKEMVTLFVNTFKSLYNQHLMGSYAQYFYDIVVIVEIIKQGIKAGRKSKYAENKITRRRNDIKVSNVEEWYKSKKNYQTHSYQTSSSQISNITFTKPLMVNQPTNPPEKRTENHPMRAYQRNQEQLLPLPMTLGEMYAKLLSIGHVAPLPFPSLILSS